MTTPRPLTLHWHEAAHRILQNIQPRLEEGPVVIGITGPVASGKSTLARLLTPCILATDSYLPDYDDIPYEHRDQPHHADWVRLASDLALLRRGEEAHTPLWSFQTHRREGYVRIAPAPIIACEGIHALHEPILPLLSLKVFVEAPGDIRWARWEAIERSGERGWGVEKARAFFLDVAEPTFAALAPAYRAHADVIVINDHPQ